MRCFQWLKSSLCMSVVLLGTTSALADGAKQTPKEAKVGVYIDMINSESNHLLENYEGYVHRVKDLEKGPTCKELGPQQWISSMGPSAPDRVLAYRKGLAKLPKLEVDAAATQMVDALDALYKPVAEASDYYFMSKFNKDNCKRGDELHPLLRCQVGPSTFRPSTWCARSWTNTPTSATPQTSRSCRRSTAKPCTTTNKS